MTEEEFFDLGYKVEFTDPDRLSPEEREAQDKMIEEYLKKKKKLKEYMKERGKWEKEVE